MDKKNKIQRILNAIETGTPDGNYGDVSIFKDGPNNIAQITYGRSQTTEYGLLKELLELYISNKGIYANDFIPYINKLEKTPLVKDSKFINLLEKAATDPIMRSTQDAFFDEFYWEPAVEWAEANGFTTPLSLLVIYDSFTQSGGILGFLRNRFKERVPAKGGNEKKWITDYVNVRHAWLKSNTYRPILRKTVYRTQAMINTIESNDWNLDKPYKVNGSIIP